jgi:hypothetical protein
MYIAVVITWFAASAGLVGYVATERNRSAGAWFAISLLFSPLIGLLALIAAGDSSSGPKTGQASASSSSGHSDNSRGGNRRKCLKNDGQTFPADRERCPYCNSRIKVGDKHPRAEE